MLLCYWRLAIGHLRLGATEDRIGAIARPMPAQSLGTGDGRWSLSVCFRVGGEMLTMITWPRPSFEIGAMGLVEAMDRACLSV